MNLLRSLLLSLLCLAQPAIAAAKPKPNIVYILADDLGYGDVRCLNPKGKIATPHLDRLAAEGMVFTDAHSSSAVCTPTRYGLLTGRYNWRSRLQSGVMGGMSPPLIEPGRLTVASFLRKQGYHTACLGKWHLGFDWARRPGAAPFTDGIEKGEEGWRVDFAKPIAGGPRAYGFDYFFGIAASLDMVPYTFIENDRVTTIPTVDKSFPMMLGRTNSATRKGPAAADFDAADVLPTLTRQAVSYLDERARQRDGRPFFLYLPLPSPHTPILPTKEWQGRSGLNPYADFVMQTDATVGALLDALDRNGQAAGTLVIFTSDNGCSPEAKFPELLAQGHNPSASLRGAKADLFEGGHRVPFLARWPGRVKPATRSHQLICLNDLFATCAEILGAKLSDNAAEDSVSFLAALEDRATGPIRESLVHHSINGSFAIRQGQWKLALCADSGGWSQPRPGSPAAKTLPTPQLYDLVGDVAETNNVAGMHPGIVEHLTRLLERYVASGRSTPGAPQPNATDVDIHKSVSSAKPPLPSSPQTGKNRIAPPSRHGMFAVSPQGDARPNILIILSDDVGYSDIGCYGGEIATPNLDALAAGGLRFTQFYNTARCCPTRASLLTGLHPHQAGVGHMMDDRGHDGYRGTLNRRCVTIAEALQSAGYRSYAAGKWHVTPGHSAQALAVTNNWPLQRGFERFYGTIHGAGSFFDPSSLVRDNRLITVANDPEYQPKEYYYTDAVADHAVRFLREHARDHRHQPFFLYTSFTAAHWPLHAKDADIAKYKGRYDGGYEPVRAARRAKLKRLGLLDDRWTPQRPAETWDAVKDKAFESRCMEVYAAQLDSMDQGIGRILTEMKAQGQFENTLIFYLQDNGGCAEGMGRGTNATQRARQPTLPPLAMDEQQFNSVPKQTRDGWPVRMGMGVMPGGPDTYIAYGRGWAHVSNTPFREYKHWTHEGGISTPLIAHWPKGITARRGGRLEAQPGQLTDLMATCLDVAGAKYPAEFRGERIQLVEGTSLRPAFRGRSLQRVKPLVWEHEGNRAIRDGKWKLVARESQPWELYDLNADRAEQHDLASSKPARVKAMSAAWDAWAARAGVLPIGAWRVRNPAENSTAKP